MNYQTPNKLISIIKYQCTADIQHKTSKIRSSHYPCFMIPDHILCNAYTTFIQQSAEKPFINQLIRELEWLIFTNTFTFLVSLQRNDHLCNVALYEFKITIHACKTEALSDSELSRVKGIALTLPRALALRLLLTRLLRTTILV